MAETNELKQKVVVDTTEAKKAISDLKKETKDYKSEVKLLDSAINKDGQTVENLTKKQKAQQDQVKTLKETLAKLKTQYDKVVIAEGADSAAAKTLKASMRDVETQLNNTEADLKTTTTALENMKKAENDTGTSAKTAGEKVKDAVSKIKTAFETVKDSAGFKFVSNCFDKIAESVTKSWELTTDMASAWDDVATAAARAQETTEDYQAMMYASDFLDFDMSAYYRGQNKVKKATEEEINGAFEEAGVSFDWDGVDFGDKEDVYHAILSQLGSLDDSQQAIIEEQIFGERLGMNLRTIYGEEAVQQLRELQVEAERLGMITTENGKASLQQLNDAHDKYLNVVDGLKMNFAAALADNMTGFYEGLSEYLGVFSKALQVFHDAGGGAEGKQAMADYLEGALTEVDENGDTVGSKLVKGITEGIENLGVFADLAGVAIDALVTELSTNEALQTAIASLWDSLGDVWGGEDGESGLRGLIKDLYDEVIKPYILDPLSEWFTAQASVIGSAIGNGIVDAIPGLRAALNSVNGTTFGIDTYDNSPESLGAHTLTPDSDIWLPDTSGLAKAGGADNSGATGSGRNRVTADTYTENDNSTYEQIVTIHVTGAQSPELTGQAIAEALADYNAQLKNGQTGGATGVSRSGNVYDY